MYRRLLRYLRPHRWRMLGTIAASVAAATLEAFSLTLFIPFLDHLFGGRASGGAIGALQQHVLGPILGTADDPMVRLQRLMVVIMSAIVAKNLLSWVGSQLGAQLQEFVTRDLRNDLYAHLQRMPLSFFHRTKTGQLLSRVFTDTAQTKQIITQAVTQSLQNVTLVVASVVWLFLISWRLTLVAAVIAPIFMGLLQPIIRRLRKGFRSLNEQYGEMTSLVQETVTGIRLVKSFRGEEYEERRFVEASGRYARGIVRVTRVARLAQPLTETVSGAVAILVLWLGVRMVIVDQTMTGATLIGFIGLVMRTLQPLKQLSQVPAIAEQSFAAAERLFEVLDSPTEVATDTGRRTDARLERSIEFDRVWFAYDGEPVLADISFTARKGDVVALVGSSGAGKSTLVDLIPRFYEPMRGRVLLDGVEARAFTLASLRALTGIVSQDTVLFNDTVRANIAYGNAGRFSDAQIEAAARAANAYEFIRELPAGFDTILGERGVRLSGGQRQRIAIARALLTDPPILILDEATSALDTQSERLVQEAIDRLLAGRTVFVIAHRLSTITHADQILVLDRGRIVERGTHHELLAREGVYSQLHALQFGGRPAPATV